MAKAALAAASRYAMLTLASRTTGRRHRVKIVLLLSAVALACFATCALVGCEDHSGHDADATVTTEELADGSIKTVALEPVTLADGTVVTQVTTTVTHPDGTSETQNVSDGAFIWSIAPSNNGNDVVCRVAVTNAASTPWTNAFSGLRPIIPTNDYTDIFRTNRPSIGDLTNNADTSRNGRWVVLSEGVSNSLEIQTFEPSP